MTPTYVSNNQTTEDHSPDTAVLDAGTGVFEVRSNSLTNEVSQDHLWGNTTRQECWQLRQFLHAIRGRQVPVLVPTWYNEILVTYAISVATSVRIANRGFAAQWPNALHPYVLFFPPYGLPWQIARVTDVTTVSATEELLTLGNSVLEVAPGSLGCWVYKCRLASDDVTLNWMGTGAHTCSVKWIRLP